MSTKKKNITIDPELHSLVLDQLKKEKPNKPFSRLIAELLWEWLQKRGVK